MLFSESAQTLMKSRIMLAAIHRGQVPPLGETGLL